MEKIRQNGYWETESGQLALLFKWTNQGLVGLVLNKGYKAQTNKPNTCTAQYRHTWAEQNAEMLALDLQEGMTGRHNYCLPMHHLKSNTLLPDLLTEEEIQLCPQSRAQTAPPIHNTYCTLVLQSTYNANKRPKDTWGQFTFSKSFPGTSKGTV